MLLAIDIGNTNVTLGVFDGEKLLATYRLATHVNQMPDEYAVLILSLLQNRGIKASDITEGAVSCVVPPLITTFNELFKKYFDIVPLFVGPGVKTGIRIRMDNPREVGPDRIADAAAAHHLYSGQSLIIIGFGTATTFNVVNREGDYLGGAIAPGINTAAEALFGRTAMLPRVELIAPKRAIGSNTIAAMQSGIMLGYLGLIEGMVARLQKELGEKATVVATGGMAHLIAKQTPVIDIINTDLTLIGIMLIYRMNKSQ